MKIFTLRLPIAVLSFKSLYKKLPIAFAARLLIMMLLCLGAGKGFAQTDLYWDANGATAGTGGTGTWNAVNTWRTGSPTGTLGNWVDGSNAIFQGTAGTVTIPTTTTITTNNVTFSTTGYIVTGATSTGKLSLGSTNKTITVGSSVVATIGTWVTASNGNAVLAGTGGITIDGSGELILAAGLQSSLSGSITVQGNSILTIGDRNQGTGSNVSLAGGTGTTGFFGGNNLVFNNGTLRIAASSNANCIVSGIGTITVNNTGTLVTWRTGTSSSMSPVLTTTSTASVTMNAGSTLSIGIGGNTSAGGTITLGAVTAAGNFSIQGASASQTFKFGTVTDGGFQMTLFGGGTSSLVGVNPINSYTAAGSSFTGSLVLGNSGGTEGAAYLPASLATTAITTGNITVYPNSQLSHAQAGSFGNAASTLTLHGNGLANTGGALNTTNAGTTTWLGATVLGANATVTTGASNILVLNSNFSGAFQLTKSGTGTLTLNGTNAGNNSSTWLTAGTLTVNSGSNLGSGALKMGDDANLNNVTLNLNNSAQTIGSLTQGSASVTRTINLGTSHALTIVQTAAGTYAGTITGATGSVTLDATSNNILTLGGANTYGGVTTIAGGTLRLGVPNAIPVAATGGGVVLNGGTLSTGSGAGFSDGAVGSTNMGTLTLSTNNSTIALGTGNHSLFFAASNGVGWTANRVLTITGWTGVIGNGSSGTAGKIFVGASTSGLTSTQLAQIKFTISAVDYPAMILSSGEIVPTLKYAITSVNGGTNPTSGSPFSITVQSQDFNGTPRNVVTTTSVFSLTTNGNAGSIGGTTTGSITNGSSSTTVSGITLSSSGSGVTLTATRTSGDQLVTGISSTFTVDAGSAPTQLVITSISPASPIVGSTFSVTVQAQNASNIASNVIANTDIILSNTGGGTFGGTLTSTITAGSNQVTLTGLSFTASGTGVTITATQTAGDPLTLGTSTGFLVSPADPTGVSATTASSTQITLAATANANTDNIIVAYNTTSSFGTPANGTAYAVNATLPTAGTVIYNGSAAGLSSHGSLTSNSIYYYKTFSYDGGNLYSAGVAANATTQAVPTTGTVGTLTSATATTAQAAVNSNSIATGGAAALSARGLAINTTPFPTTLVSSGTTTGTYSQTLTGLNAQTLYYTRAYATNAGGTTYGSDVSFRTLSAIPTAQTGTFTAAAVGASQINLAWTTATFPGSGATNTGYIILRRTDGTNPATTGVTVGTAPGSLSLPSGTTLLTDITSGATLSFNNTGLSASFLYNYMIIPYTWDGTNPETYNYFLTSPKTSSATTFATGYYWNGGSNVANPANGGTGNWSDANNWRIDYNGAQATWADANPAFLGGTAGTVTLSASVAPGSTTVQTAGYTLATSGASAISLSGDLSLGANGVTTAPISGADLTVSGIISGASAITKSNTGTLFINNAGNTFSGGTVINAGTVSIDGPSRLGSSVGAVTINAATLQVTGNVSSARNFTIGNAASIIDISNAVTYTANSASTFSGTGRINKTGAGTLIFPLINATSHTYSGGLTISGGTVQINKERDLGALPGSATPGNVVLDGGTLASNATLTISANRGIAVGPTSGSGNGTIDVANGTTLTYGGILANNGGTGSLIKTGTGTLALTVANTYTGTTTINAGIVSVNGINRIGVGGDLNINAGTFQATASISSSRNFVLGDVASTVDISSGITYTQNVGAVISGTGTLNKLSTGTLLLGGTNTYSGPTNISAGTINLTGSLSSSSAVTVSSGATLSGTGNAAGTVDVSGTISPNGTSIGTLNSGNENWNSAGTYRIDLNNVTGSAGTINDLLAITGTLTTAGTFNISLNGTITGFSYATAASWTIATTTGGITNGATYTISTAAITNAIGSGVFTVAVSGNNLVLNFTPGQATIAFTTTAGSTTALIGSSINVMYQTNLAVTGNDATFTGVTFATAGNYQATDIAANGIKLWYSTSSTFSTGTATQIGSSITSTSSGTGETLAFTSGISQALTSGATYYLYVTVDYTVGATVGRTINITSTATTNFTFGATVTRSGTSGVGTTQTITGYSVTAWTGGASNAWLNTGNWSPAAYPSGSSAIANFNINTQPTVGINMGTLSGVLNLGTIQFGSSATTVRTINNSSGTTSGIITLNGTVLNAIANVILLNSSATTHLFTNGSSTMGIALGNSTNNIVNIDGTGGLTISNIISGANPITKAGLGSGILTLSAANTYTGSTTINTGTLSISSIANGGSNSNIGASTNAATNLVLGGGTLQYTGSTVSTNRNFTLTNSTISSIEVTTGATSLTLSGGSANTTGALTKVGVGTLILTGVNAHTGLTTVSAGTLQLNRSGGATIPATNNLTINGGTLKVSTNQTVNDLTLSSGTLTVDASVTLTINGSFTGGGTIINNGKIILVGCSTFPGATTTITAMNDLEINRSAGVTLDKSLTISGTLTFTSGNLTIGSNTLTLNGAVVNTSGSFTGSSTSNMTIGGAAGTLNFTQTSAATRSLNNLLFTTATASATLGTALDVFGNIKLNNGVGIDGSLDLNGQNVTLKSNITSTATIDKLILSGTNLSNATNVTVERYIPLRRGLTNGGRAYRLLTPTVTTPAITGTINTNWQNGETNTVAGTNINLANPGYGVQITGTAGSAAGLDVTQNNQASLYTTVNGPGPDLAYLPVLNTNVLTLDALKGYFLYIRGDRSSSMQLAYNPAGGMPTTATTLTAKGTVQTGTISFSVTPVTDEYSMVTNPYPAPIDWSKVVTTNTGKIYTTYTAWDAFVGTEGGFVEVQTNGTNNVFGSTANQYIQPGQAFLVRTLGGAPTSISITEDMKAVGNNNNTIFGRQHTSFESFAIDLYLTEANNQRHTTDGVLVSYGNGYSSSLDGDDAGDVTNWNENIAIARAGKEIAMEARPVIVSKDTIPLIIGALRQTGYEWVFTPSMFTNTSLKAELIDNFLNTRTLLSVIDSVVVPFTVTANPASSAANRFMVVFGPFSPLAIDVITIKAQAKNNGVQVDWTAKTEQDMDRYELERSFNGNSFSKIKTTAAVGNSPVAVNYGWLDASPQAGTNFYRIKAIDNAGLVKYTNIVKVDFGKTNPTITVSPNPVTGNSINLKLADLAKGSYTLQLFNSIGQQVLVSRFNHAGGPVNQPVNLTAGLASGTYQLVLSGGETRLRTTIIKN